jgi:hypothetical protein
VGGRARGWVEHATEAGAARAPYIRAVYTTCLRCDRSLGANTEIPHLRVGRRIAFDTKRGRLWVICPHCDQWNLTPIEERWEALEECEQLATQAEARGSGTRVALAQTESGLELLRVGDMGKADIANWRYGRRIGARNAGHLWWLMPIEAVAISAGIAMWRATHRVEVTLWIATVLGLLLFFLWRKPPRLWTRFDDGTGRSRLLWFWQRQLTYIERTSGDSRPALVLPRWRGDLRLTGDHAVTALASLLPRINGADCVGVDLNAALDTVTSAEKGARKQPLKLGRGARRRMREKHQTIPTWREQRPWELVALRMPTAWLASARPEDRLALEMAVTEEVERRQLAERSEVLAEAWQEEEEVGAISDDLLLPEGVQARLEELRKK